MEIIASDQFLLFAAGVTGITLLLGVLVIAVQIKREQFRLSENLKTISSAMDTLEGLLQLREETQKWRDEEIKEIADASRALQDWRSRMTAVYSEAGHLFESEPIRELIDGFGPQPTSYTAKPPGRGNGADDR